MKPNSSFCNQSKLFWAHIRLVGQECGYSQKGEVLVPTREMVEKKLAKKVINTASLDSLLPTKETLWDKIV